MVDAEAGDLVFVARGAIHREEAERYCAIAEQIGAEDDLATQVLRRSAKPKVLSARGEHDGAMVLARAAVCPRRGNRRHEYVRGQSYGFALVLSATGDSAEHVEAIRRARELYSRKGNVVSAGVAEQLEGSAS